MSIAGKEDQYRMSGTFVLSLDTELAWGSFDKRWGPDLIRVAEWENRQGIPRLLELVCRYQISATWAFVGHATLDCCSGHPELEPVSYDRCSGNWFRHDPASNETRHPAWYARSCFLNVLRAPCPQEIAFHSFSHVDFSDPGTPRERAVQEFAACREIASEFGIAGDVFVYPGNRVAFLDELLKSGFRAFRAPDVTPFRSRSTGMTRAVGVLADFFAITPLCVAPYLDNGLVVLPTSMMLRSLGGWRRVIPLRARRARIMKGIARCIQERSTFHLWFHPFNLYYQQQAIFELLEECLCSLNLLRRRGDLRIATMGEIAREYLTFLQMRTTTAARSGVTGKRATGLLSE